MPVELDLTGCCYVCYMPMFEGLGGLLAGPGKVCPYDPEHTPRVQFTTEEEVQLLIDNITEDLRVTRDLDIGGSELDVGSELFVEPGQGFILDEGDKPFNPPYNKKGLYKLLEDCQVPCQLTFRLPKLPGDLPPGAPPRRVPRRERPELVGVELDGGYLRQTGKNAPSEAQATHILVPPRDSPEQRVDPEDGVKKTFRELERQFCKDYSKQELDCYWRDVCQHVPINCQTPSMNSSAALKKTESGSRTQEAAVLQAPEADAETTAGRAVSSAKDAAVLQAPVVDAETAIGSWLRRIDATGFLDVYVKNILAHFSSEDEVRRAMVHKDGSGKLNLDPQFYSMAGIKKAGHKRLFERWFTDAVV
eukprot:gnl/MRDRNA2_/MRDRNA2_73929_c0_seq1.p1 gnl/MRDRNA2_/MRDRNA2_73929_c0~~gnl/MRDRNA2_/MRDRNA2_73929_c0_seq1.p1  ORF type:complete len:362 (-),score=69.06 gnl/MRDRNA2_/MRDRNA2_73929_c0_seq1:13-1098(-)